MSAIANIVAYDGAATPVSHTFVPAGVSRENGTVTASWKESNTALPDEAQGRVTMTSKLLPSGVYRITSRVELPVMEAVAGVNSAGYTAAPKVAYVDTVETVGYFSKRSLPVGRRTVRQLADNIMNGIVTSFAPVVTGPAPELFDLLVTPT